MKVIRFNFLGDNRACYESKEAWHCNFGNDNLTEIKVNRKNLRKFVKAYKEIRANTFTLNRVYYNLLDFLYLQERTYCHFNDYESMLLKYLKEL